MSDEKPKLYRERVTLNGNEESRDRAEAWIKENGTFIGVKSIDGIKIGSHYLMERGSTISYEVRSGELSAEVISYDEVAGKMTLDGLIAVASRDKF